MSVIRNLFSNPNYIIFGATIIGTLITAIGVFWGTQMKDKEDLEFYVNQNNSLKATVNKQKEELLEKNSEITRIATDNAELLKKIDKNNKAIRKLTRKTADITDKTNFLVGVIKNEQKEKGTLRLMLLTPMHIR